VRTQVTQIMFSLAVALLATILLPACTEDQDKAISAVATTQPSELKPQITCPIMGEKINREVFVDVAGYRFYACCKPCLAKIEADPDKALASLRAKGEKPELRLVVCSKCGEIKGSILCCKPGATKCLTCGLNKGSIGCCKNLKPAGDSQDVVICAKCGEIKGSAICCKPGVEKCSKCNLNKGAPGCCKIGAWITRGRQ